MKIISKKNYREASKILKNGGLVAFPTETVFGIGVVYDNKESYDRLIEVKRRPPEKPFTLMCARKKDVYKYAYVNESAKKLIRAFFPGQFTIILKAKEDLPQWVKSEEGNVGIRVPDFSLAQKIIKKTRKPLLVPSANRSGEEPLTRYADVFKAFNFEIDAVVEGESTSNVPSTIVIIDKDVKIIREGLITKEMINKVLEDER